MSQVRGCVTAVPVNTHNLTLTSHTESSVAQWLEHPTRSRWVVGLSPIWGSDFSEFRFLLEYHVVIVVVSL